ncbi:MAG: PTS sugar transporter subunit IIA [Deltaproteobacteria bacterium]|nr:PTS sugar transporter subunit IIA [Deltaproteobacteria bacterium]
MKFSDIITEDSIIPELAARDKEGVLEELAQAICNHAPSVDKSDLVRVLLEREKLGSTGIGEGVAIPHGKINTLSQPMISFGRSKRGLDFDSMDAQPAYLFFLLVAPENSAGLHLKTLAKIAKILKSRAFRKKLMEAKTREEIYEAIIKTDEEENGV